MMTMTIDEKIMDEKIMDEKIINERIRGEKILAEESKSEEKKDCCLPFPLACPPVSPVSTVIALVLLILLVYGTLWGFLRESALPGGPVFALLILLIVCYLGGQFIRLLNVPSLVGMMICGFVLRNAPHINIADDIPDEWTSNIRNVALVLILLRAGLEVDPNVLKSNTSTCLQLILIPFLVECVAGGVVSHYLLHLPWMYAFLTGFMLAAVSPAVVLPVMLKLQKKGIGTSNGIPTMVIAVAGIDDVLALTGFEVILGITFSTGGLAWTIIKGPVEVIIGIVYGILMGLIAWYIPNPKEEKKSVFRVLILSFGGMFIMFGSQALNYGGAGALGCICLPFVAAIQWKKEDWNEDNNPINVTLLFVWRIIEPFLFGLIGSEIRIHELHPSTIGFGLATLFIALAFRMLASLLAAFGAGLTFKEQIFVMFAGLPKATVQAAIGPVALSYARKLHLGPEYEQYGIEIVTVAVLAVLITAPLGATAIALLAPKLLESDHVDTSMEDLTEREKTRLRETRLSIFDLDDNIFTVARL